MSYLFDIPCYEEKDGKLGSFEPDVIPDFHVNRLFYILDVPEGQTRADHACMNASIVFIAMAGKVQLSVEEDGNATEYCLSSNVQAVYTSPGSWIKAYQFSEGAVLMGISDKRYQDCEYINDYQLYRNLVKGNRK